MKGEMQSRVDVFALTLQVVDREGSRLHVRAMLRGPGLSATVGTVVGRDELRALLEQLERQYADFKVPVRWETRASPSVHLSWRLDPAGHLDGRAEIRDRSEGWAASVRLRGDQSYLPRVALGLRLLVRTD
jgi:hypothetical protein